MGKKDVSIKNMKESVLQGELPRHIAIIMDGNGRWAKKRALPRNFGHQEGMERVIEVVETASSLGIEYLSLYAFSTENWKRPKSEINGLMQILIIYIRNELNKLHKNNIKLQIMGDISRLPKAPREEVIRAIEKTKDNDKMVLNIALNYGGRDEIIHGIKGILKDLEMGKIDLDEINIESFSDYLYTKNQPDPDLIIRASGEQRLSNFMLYQLAYSELWFSNVLWPDFKEEHLYEAIGDYQKRDRRFGGI